MDWNDELINVLEAAEGKRQAPDKGKGRDEAAADFAQMIFSSRPSGDGEHGRMIG